MNRIRRKKVRTGGATVKGLPFMGEMMICEICSKTERSDPLKESGWTVISLDDENHYYCPTCFGKILQGDRNPD